MSYQPYWAVRAEALRRRNDPASQSAVERAIGLTADDALRRHLLPRIEA